MTRPLPIRAILWLTISVLTLMIAVLTGREAAEQWEKLQNLKALSSAVIFSDKLFDAINKISVERDVAYALLHAPDKESVSDLRIRLTDDRNAADASFAAAMAYLHRYPFSELDQFQNSVEKYLAGIAILRRQIDQALTLQKSQRDGNLADRWYGEVTMLTGEAQDLWLKFIQHFIDIDPVVTLHLRYKHTLLIISDYTGRERALIGKLIVESAAPTPQEVGRLLRWQGIIDLSWRNARLIAEQSGLYTAIGHDFQDAESHYETMYDMVRDMFYVSPNRNAITYPISADLWFELSRQYDDSLETLREVSIKVKHAYLNRLIEEGKQAIALHLGMLAFALLLCAYCFWVINRRVIYPINAIIKALLDASRGKSVSFPAASIHTRDEIGKLVLVLNAFQENVEKIKHTSAMLENYTRELERSNKELDDFAYIASHDLKEPLRGLFNHATFLIEDYQDKLGEDGVRRLQRLSYLAQRMEHLVNDLLYFSRIGRTELAIQKTDPNAIVDDIRLMLEPFIKERNAHIIVPKRMPSIVCDRPRITEVFRNLITNAVKYNDKPRRIIEVGFLENIASPHGNEKNVFYVKDNGIGIATEFYDDIFHIFKRLPNPMGDKEPGTGAGLTFVKKIIERHKGRIWLESEPGKGTTFYFTVGEIR